MKKQISILLILIIFIMGISPSQALDDISALRLSCDSFVLMDATTGNVLYEKNADKREYPASTTKILTTSLALERGYYYKSTVVSSNAVKSIGIDGTNASLKAGEKVTIRDLIHMALIISANDAANAIAEAVSGSTKNFVALMNQKVKQLGLKNTTFLNPIGLDVEDGYKGHMTTARDLAVIMRYATSIGEFRSIIGKSDFQPQKTNIHTKTRPVWKTTDKLLTDTHFKSSDYQVIGGKTGYTKAAKHVFVACARNSAGSELIVVLMGNSDRNVMFGDAKKLFDYGFSKIKSNPDIAPKGFYDIRNRYSENAINIFYQKGFISGDNKGAFNYSQNATKEMFIKVLTDLRGIRITSQTPYWSKAYLDKACEEGLIDSSWYSDRGQPVTRGEVISVLGKLIDIQIQEGDREILKEQIKAYDSIAPELKDPVLKIFGLGIMTAVKDGTMGLSQKMTREEMIMALYRFYESRIIPQK